MEKKSTKDRVIFAALDLFSEKGYDGVGVDQIAEAVGIKGPSLYHHFKGKEQILDSIIDKFSVYYSKNFGSENALEKFPASVEELVEGSLARIRFTISDENIKKIRKLMTIEQFRNEKLSVLTTAHQLTGLVNLHTKIFENMMENGIIKKCDPEVLALEFIAPTALLIQTVDREPEKMDWAMEMSEKYMRHFAENYKA